MKKILLTVMFTLLICSSFVYGYTTTKRIFEIKQVDVVKKAFEKQDMFQIGDDLKPNCKVVWYTVEKVTINSKYKKELEDDLGKFNIYKIDSVVYAKDEKRAYPFVCYAYIEFGSDKGEFITEDELKERK